MFISVLGTSKLTTEVGLFALAVVCAGFHTVQCNTANCRNACYQNSSLSVEGVWPVNVQDT